MTGRLLFILLLTGALCLAQTNPDEAEDEHLSRAMAETGSSPLEFIRAAEQHLQKYPGSARLPVLEASLARPLVAMSDNRRIVLYGERVLAVNGDDADLLERVAEALLAVGGKAEAERALRYARRYEELVRVFEKAKPTAQRQQAAWREEVDRELGKAFLLQARAVGIPEEADRLARRSHETYPTAEAARLAGQGAEALTFLAEAFVLSDLPEDRRRLGDVYRKLKGSEAGLGDLVLEAFDRVTARRASRVAALRLLDSNLGVSNPMDFSLSAFRGEPLRLSSLRGKVVVFDFWATWCGPCRGQHPLYEIVKKKYRDNPDVVFLSVNTDEDAGLVGPFLEETGWSGTVYFEDGLSNALQVSSIPTTIIGSRRGEIVTRMNGYIPERFVAMLTERIEEALADMRKE